MQPLSDWMGKIRGHEQEHAQDHDGTDPAPPPANAAPLDREELNEKVVATLREIYDPEIPVNIYDLGLIYNVEISDDGEVDIDMTLTTPGCPVAATFPGTVESLVGSIPEVTASRVELVWDPPWTIDRMPDEVKLELGLL